jgi:hypothetical protein
MSSLTLVGTVRLINYLGATAHRHATCFCGGIEIESMELLRAKSSGYLDAELVWFEGILESSELWAISNNACSLSISCRKRVS